MRLLLLATMTFLKAAVDSLPQNPVDTSSDALISTDSTDSTLHDVANANVPLDLDDQSGPIAVPTDDSGFPIAMSVPLVSNSKDSDLIASTSTGSVDSNADNPGLLIGMSKKEDAITPTILNDDDDFMPSCSSRKRYHCCYVVHGLSMCIAITSLSQSCHGSEFIMCCAGIKPRTAPKRKPKYGFGGRCEPVTWSHKPTLEEKTRGFLWDKASGFGNFFLGKIKDLQNQSPQGNDLINPNNWP